MKKMMMSLLTLALVGGTASAAVDTAKLTTAILGLVGSLAGNIPPIITDIQKFPTQAKGEADKMRQGMIALNQYMKSAEYGALTEAEKKVEKQKKLDELFLYGADLSILVTNLMYKVMEIVKQIGPVILAVDEVKGRQANDALQLAVQIMQMVNSTNQAMKKQIVEKLPADQKAEVAPTPKADAVPSLEF
ncbi:MAG TPA: hypothetical protein PKD74_03995 [Candidatus Dependentiae bacterium]|nr:hypothetical protein [Candidatus Dependentiae bacterium]